MACVCVCVAMHEDENVGKIMLVRKGISKVVTGCVVGCVRFEMRRQVITARKTPPTLIASVGPGTSVLAKVSRELI